MKQDTKKLVLVGGAALAALYAYSTMGGEDYAGMGGGGGLPLLSTLPEAAAEVAPIIVNIPGMKPPIGWGDMPLVKEDGEGLTKKMSFAPTLLPTYPLEYYSAGGISELSPAATQPQKLKSVMELQHYSDPLAYAFSGRKEGMPNVAKAIESKKSESKPWYAPWTWDTSDAVKNYQAWATRSTERTLNISKSDKSQTADTIIAKKIETQRNRSRIEYRPSGGGSKEWSGGLTSTTKGAGVHFTTSGTGTLRKRPKKSSAPGSPD